jgi:hypothetical protein
MKRRLFLTGPIGCGKSTAISQALGHRQGQCGGFLTRRHRHPCLHFTLECPNGSSPKTFLDFSTGKPEIRLSVFSNVSFQGSALVLDEIGGIELLNPDFSAALDAALDSDVPILGVLKGDGPADALIAALGLTQAYQQAAQALRQRLLADSHTLIYHCGHYDENALHLARQWTEEYLHD